MPALTSFSKEAIIDTLTTIIRELEKENSELKRQINHMDRKQQHGCSDATCPICDGPEPKRRKNS